MNSKRKEHNSLELPKLKFKYVPTVTVSLELNVATSPQTLYYILKMTEKIVQVLNRFGLFPNGFA